MDSRLFIPILKENIQNALKSWHRADSAASPFAGLQILHQTLSTDASNDRLVTNKILSGLLDTLRENDTEGATLLSRRFLDGEKMQRIANSLNISEATAYRIQGQAIARLAVILQAKEIEARDLQQTILEQRLDKPTYTQLFGVEGHLDSLEDLLTKSGSPWLISIEGLGGVGKTSLAHAIAHRVISQRLFDDVGWISARQHFFKLRGEIQSIGFPALTADDLVSKLIAQLMPEVPKPETLSSQEAQHLLQTRLRQRRHLVVVDNLETIQDLEELLPTLTNLGYPSKFLLTSRRRLDYGNTVYYFPLPELSQASALRLIRYEIEQHNLTHLRQVNDDDLKKIFDVVGGNPLALRLVVGQTHVFSLDTILDDLLKARSKTVEELYTFIYWQAWNVLDEAARNLFLAMLLITDEGERIKGLAESSQLDIATVHNALKQLVNLNLVNSLGDHKARYYTIHNLTRSFLQEQVLKWKQ